MLSTKMTSKPAYTRRNLVIGETQDSAPTTLMNSTQASNTSGHHLQALYQASVLSPSCSAPRALLENLPLLMPHLSIFIFFHHSGDSSPSPVDTCHFSFTPRVHFLTREALSYLCFDFWLPTFTSSFILVKSRMNAGLIVKQVVKTIASTNLTVRSWPLKHGVHIN